MVNKWGVLGGWYHCDVHKIPYKIPPSNRFPSLKMGKKMRCEGGCERRDPSA